MDAPEFDLACPDFKYFFIHRQNTASRYAGDNMIKRFA
ncbi:hypothetical protein J537_2845 [Acinetobacter baumannii 1437282]|nr:hypothetical protein J537_2845 [Acinetobacter baumannii 1437282]